MKIHMNSVARRLALIQTQNATRKCPIASFLHLFVSPERLQQRELKTAVCNHASMRARKNPPIHAHGRKETGAVCLPASAAGKAFAALQEIAADP